MAPPKEEMRNGKYQKQDIAALRKSIKHWKKDNVGKQHPSDIKTGPDECALCVLYTELNDDIEDNRDCEGCPVYHKTGEQGCVDSPYTTVAHLQNVWKVTREKPEKLEEAVAAEITFLEELLKEAEAQFKKGVA